MFSYNSVLIIALALSACVLCQPDGTSGSSSSINYVCLDCVKLVDAALNFMKDKPIQDDVINIIDNEVCGRLNYVFMKDCTDQVEGFIPYLMYYLQNKISRVAICQGFNLCPYTPYTAASTPLPTPSKQFIKETLQNTMLSGVTGAIPSQECQYCQLAEGEISMLLENQQAKNIVKQYLGEICDDLPFNSVECTNLLALYVDQVFHITLGYLQQNEFCIEFGLCPKAVAADQADEAALNTDLLIE